MEVDITIQKLLEAIMKKVIIGAILIVGLAAGFAWAHGGSNGHMGYGNNHMMGYSNSGGNYGGCPGAGLNGQGSWDAESQQKFLDETKTLRQEMNDKRFQYVEAQRNPATTQGELAALEQEIIELRGKIAEVATANKK